MLKMLIIVAAFIPISLLMPIWLNSVDIFEDPGSMKRLKTYLTTNEVRTAADHPFPELRTPYFDVAPDEMFQILLDAAAVLDFEIQSQDRVKLTVAYVVTSSLWRFKDDLTVVIMPQGDGSALEVHSISRKGRGDFGANLGHVQRFLRVVEDKVAAKES